MLAACRDNVVRDVLPDLRRTAAIREALTPIARCLEHTPHPPLVLQRSLELPADLPIHRAAADLLARGVVPPVHVSLAPLPRPTGDIQTLLLSTRAPVVFAGEKARVSVWSTESGALLSQIPLPKTATTIGLAELPDGTLRALTDRGEVHVRGPDAPAFKRVVKFEIEDGKFRERLWAGSSDLRYHLVPPSFHPRQDGTHALHLYDVQSSKPRILALAGRPEAYVSLGPATIGAWYRRDTGPGFAAIDLTTGDLRVTRLPEDTRDVHPGRDGRSLLLQTHADTWHRLDLGAGTHHPLAAHALDPIHKAPLELLALVDTLRGGVVPKNNGEIHSCSGELLAYHADVPQFAWSVQLRRLLLPGPNPGWYVVSRGGPDSTVSVIAPYDPARAAAAPPPPPPGPAPDWARTGVDLFYDIADHDTADAYRLRIVAADDGLTLQIDRVIEDSPRLDRVVQALRFTAAAIESGDDPVLVAQGGVDTGERTTDRLPPNLLPRRAFARLCAGEAVTLHHRWLGEPATLQPCGDVEARTVAIDGDDARVPTRVCTGDLTITVLDDPRWPLILELAAGDCQLRLTAMATSRTRNKR